MNLYVTAVTLLILFLTAASSAPTAPQPAAKGRALIVLTNHSQLGTTGRTTGFFLSEAAHPHKVFTDAGLTVDFASPKGGLAPVDPSSLPKSSDSPDTTNTAFLASDTIQAQIKNTLKVADINPADYDIVFFAGGHGTMWDFPDNRDIQRLTAAVYERGGIIAAVCHGPAALINVRLSNGQYLVANQAINSFTDEEESASELSSTVPFLLESTLRQRGAVFQESPNFQPHTATSNRLVTGQNPASASATAQAAVKLLPSPTTRPAH